MTNTSSTNVSTSTPDAAGASPRTRRKLHTLRWLFTLLVVAGAFLAGRYFAPLMGPVTGGDGTTQTAATPEPAAKWTCSMHPQIRLDGPGMCPICEMPLIPAGSSQGGGDGPPVLTLSEHAIAMASVQTTPVVRREVWHEMRAVGKVEYNEWSLATVTTRVDGYAEKLFVNFTGVEIKAGDHLAEVYSPELLVAQEELLIAHRAGPSGLSVEPVKLKLRRWGLTEQQIADLLQAQKIAERITLYSPIDGTVIEKNIIENSFFKAGDALYRVANLDTVWVNLDIYEYDLPWVRYGQRVEIIAEAYPGRLFSGMVTFVQPVLNEQTRTIRVPVHVENRDHALKPGMYVSAVIKAALGADGQAAPTGIEGKYSCPMHPQVLREQPGACPICEMPLEQIPGAARPAQSQPDSPPAPRFFCPMECEGEKTYDQPGRCPVCNMRLEPLERQKAPSGPGLLVVPVTAVLDSGLRRIVYVETGGGTFEPREVAVGPRSGELYPVLSGLKEEERVVTRGGFLIDSQFQVTGHASLLYPGGLHAEMGHQHGSDSAAQAPQPPPASMPSEQAAHQH